MIIRIDNYNLGRKVASLVFADEAYEELINNNLEAMMLRGHSLYFWKSGATLKISQETCEKLSMCDDYDVFQIDEKGNAYLYYSNENDDNAFVITGKCNSNCIMCPTGSYIRKHGENADMEELKEIVRHIPTDARHITITGGEPFLVGHELFDFLQALKNKFKRTDFLLLTNGRALSIPSYSHRFNETAPENMIIGIPLHGHNDELHDMITQSPGGFAQTVSGIQNLLSAERKVEIRIVVSMLNHNHISDIVDLVIDRFPGAYSVKIMGMEMSGNAAINRDKLWLSYSDAFAASKEGIDKLIANRIDVSLYNFPLCSVDSNYRMLCKKSITDYKIRYAEACEQCAIKDACGGIFAGTFLMAKDDVIPQKRHDK